MTRNALRDERNFTVLVVSGSSPAAHLACPPRPLTSALKQRFMFTRFYIFLCILNKSFVSGLTLIQPPRYSSSSAPVGERREGRPRPPRPVLLFLLCLLVAPSRQRGQAERRTVGPGWWRRQDSKPNVSSWVWRNAEGRRSGLGAVRRPVVSLGVVTSAMTHKHLLT